MKFGLRTPSLKKSISARTSIKKRVAPKMPKGTGFLRNPKKAAYNKVYNKTTFSAFDVPKKKRTKKSEGSLWDLIVFFIVIYAAIKIFL